MGTSFTLPGGLKITCSTLNIYYLNVSINKHSCFTNIKTDFSWIEKPLEIYGGGEKSVSNLIQCFLELGLVG